MRKKAVAHGLHYLYRPIDLRVIRRQPEDVGDLLRAGIELGFNAFNITHPCKQLVMEHLDDIHENARAIGAVNTVVINDGKLKGYNTDDSGFGWGLKTGLPDAKLTNVLQLGAGGAGSAVAYALLDAGTEMLSISDPDSAKTDQLVAELSHLFPSQHVVAVQPEQAPKLLHDATGLVNASPVGMHHHPGLPISTEMLASHHWVADCIYRPVETPLIREAKQLGCKVLDGGYMAVGQAVDAFSIITGLTPDHTRMRTHLLEMLKEGR